MSSYDNDLRLEEIVTGAQSGTWGDTTNVNLKLIAEAFSYGTEAISGTTHDTTIANGVSDPGRSMYLKYTGSLSSACTISLLPNTVSKVWIIENATSGSQNIIISQGSGANVTIANGKTKAVYTDGAGSGAAVYDAFASLDLSATPQTSVKTTAIQFTDGDSAMTIADGGGITIGTSLDMDAKELILDTDGNTSITADVNNQIDFRLGGTDRVQFTESTISPVSDSQIDLGTSSLAFRNAYIDSLGVGTSASGTAGEITASVKVTSAAFFYSSDAALKEDIQTIENPLEKVQALRGVSYKWKDTGRKDIGLVADEVQKVLPELVAEGEHKTMDYGHMIGLLVEAIKEQQKEIEELKK